MERFVYPFSAIVGQEKMKLALILNAIHPAIGGVLIRGERGTGKSTAVRGLARLLPEQHVVEGCHFGCDPDLPEALCVECRMRAEAAPLPVAARHMRVVELPINASEDRVAAHAHHETAVAVEFRDADTALTAAPLRARRALPGIVTTPAQARLISRICVEAGVAGHRADLVVERTARALAAFREHRSPP